MRVKIQRSTLIAALEAKIKEAEKQNSSNFEQEMKRHVSRSLKAVEADLSFTQDFAKKLRNATAHEATKLFQQHATLPRTEFGPYPTECGHDSSALKHYGSKQCNACEQEKSKIERLRRIVKTLKLSSEETLSLSEDDAYLNFL